MKRNNKKLISKQILPGLLTIIMMIALFAGIPTKDMSKVQAATTLSSPRISDGKVTYDCIYFGNYPQSDATGKTTEPIKWRVLSVDGNDAFLVADQNLDVYTYNTGKWEFSTMRRWLNGYKSSEEGGYDYSSKGFIVRAFTPEEQEAILTTTVVNADNPEFGTEGGNDTQDKIFLLSYDEVTNPAYGFSSINDADETRIRTNTAYVAKGGSWTIRPIMESEGEADYWWLRSIAFAHSFVRYVSSNGMIANGYSDTVHNDERAICPALHLDLSSLDLWSYAGTESKAIQILTEKLEITGISTKVTAGEKITLTPVFMPANVTNQELVWTSSNTAYATVDSKGVVTTKKEGAGKSVTITATTKDGSDIVATYTIDIEIPTEKLQIKGISKKIAAGKKITLTPVFTPTDVTNKNLIWTSSNTAYATVDSKCVVTTKKKGAGKSVTITATTQDGSNIAATYKINIVKHAVKSIKLTAKNKTVKAGKNLTLKATIKTTGKSANKVLQWTSSNENYATVTKKGVLKTKKAGKGKTVKITAKATDGTNKKATIKIKIK